MTEINKNAELKKLFDSSGTVYLITDDADLPLEVVEVKNIKSSIPEQVAFSVLLRAKPEQLWEQGIFEIRLNNQTTAVFMVPINQTKEGVTYEIIFN